MLHFTVDDDSNNDKKSTDNKHTHMGCRYINCASEKRNLKVPVDHKVNFIFHNTHLLKRCPGNCLNLYVGFTRQFRNNSAMPNRYEISAASYNFEISLWLTGLKYTEAFKVSRPIKSPGK